MRDVDIVQTLKRQREIYIVIIYISFLIFVEVIYVITDYVALVPGIFHPVEDEVAHRWGNGEQNPPFGRIFLKGSVVILF